MTSINAGVDAIGFLVGITHEAEDRIEIISAKKIISSLPPFITSVAVTHLQDPYEIIDIMEDTGANAIQIQNDVTPETIETIKERSTGQKIIKCIHVTGPDCIENAMIFDTVADALILDSRTPGRLGGTGNVHDWNISKEIVKKVKSPVILAGGLNPENVKEAIEKVHPYAVDANSGLENKNGYKDIIKVRDFVKTAKSFL
ncbi:phosphoribosylanthranilate isomerase [Methanocella sp. CWC-04]|uniref:N-(5'-phosphoribosyl)anthranilate isomerase n=2 Tax=Methanooceanicella nereidis TaxID=2052831 RepID=A0AAP2RDW0_9EURY|nr:phosphoribosylanthranilate isomerase [Methanocella sp. CWC-04]